VFGDETCPDGLHGVGKDETLSAVGVYTDEELQKIKKADFDSIWVHGLLRHLVKVDPFPELYKHAELHLNAMRQLIGRAAEYDIKVFLYMQPPRAWSKNDLFWSEHPDIWGIEDEHRNTPVRSMCTSVPEVQQWLTNASQTIARDLPDLAGIILITASEFNQHCYSRRRKDVAKPWSPLIECPICKEREPEDVVAELITLIRNGVRMASDTIEIIAWNWAWDWEKDSNKKIIEQLPSDVVIMADFERGGYKDLYGRPDFYMNEYSLSYAGPSEECQAVFEICKKRNMRFMSKLQLGTTHELASVVTLPMPGSLYDKAICHRNKDIAGYMGCWNFGNALPNSNVEAFNFFVSDKCPDNKDAALREFASQYFPDAKTELLLQAWAQFAAAMYYYPFTIGFLYHGPQNHTLAYKEMYVPAPLGGKPAGRSWKMDERGDDLTNSYNFHHKQFNLDEIIDRLNKLAISWQCGISKFKEAFKGCKNKRSLDELGNAIICGAIWRSTENSYRIYKLRKDWNESKSGEFYRILDDELNILNDVLPWVKRDPRQGFHIEPHDYMFNAETVAAKRLALEKLKSAKADRKEDFFAECV
jgi:hypothetical protein